MISLLVIYQYFMLADYICLYLKAEVYYFICVVNRRHPSSRKDFCILLSDDASQEEISLIEDLVDFLETSNFSGEKFQGWYRQRDVLRG